MLSLTRNIGQEVMIGEDIRIKVLGCCGNQVRLGFEAPKDLSVHRQEVYMRIQKEALMTDVSKTSSLESSPIFH